MFLRVFKHRSLHLRTRQALSRRRGSLHLINPKLFPFASDENELYSRYLGSLYLLAS